MHEVPLRDIIVGAWYTPSVRSIMGPVFYADCKFWGICEAESGSGTAAFSLWCWSTNSSCYLWSRNVTAHAVDIFQDILPLHQHIFSSCWQVTDASSIKSLAWLCSQFMTLHLNSSSVWNCCPQTCTFICPNKWRWLGAKSQLSVASGAFIKSAVSGWALSCSRMIFDNFPGLFFQITWCISLQSKLL
jgi:hypothetical protein